MNNDNTTTITDPAATLEGVHITDEKPVLSKRTKAKLKAAGATTGTFIETVDHEPELARIIDTDEIHEGDNYRHTYPEEAQRELENSVRTNGVLEDITVRPRAKGGFEVVFGTRRFRAAKTVGIKKLACKVRALSDEKALELQLVENIQRVDVDPLDEAEAFEVFRSKMGKTAEEIAARIGKSTQHVYNRLKLGELCEEGRKAYRDGILTVYTAMIVARIPHVDLQKKCIAWARGWHEPPTARAFANHVRYNFMLDLSKAPFDRKSLTLVKDAPACGECPKRTGSTKQGSLFADVESKDMCTDPKCYQAKVDADAKLKLEALSSQGVKVLEAKETKKIFGSTSDYVSPHTGFKDLDEKQYDDNGRGGKTLRALIKGAGAKVTVVAARAPSGKVVEMVKVAELAKSGALKKLAPTGTASKSTAQDAERRKKIALRKEITAVAMRKIVDAAEVKSRDDKAFWLFLAEAFLENAGSETALDAARRRDLEGKKNAGANWSPLGAAAPLKKKLPDMHANELRGLVVDLACGVGAHFGEGLGKHVKAGAELYNIDLAKCTTEAKAAKKAPKPKAVSALEIKKAAKAARGKAPKKPAKKGRRS
jgi:ParB/RepB/Spo0J family partition protein